MVADGTKGHKRQRDSHAVLHMLRISVPSAYSGERLRSRISLASELRDGTRDSVLALKNTCSPLRWQSCGAAALFEYFAYFVVYKICAGSPLHAVLFSVSFPSTSCSGAYLLVYKIHMQCCAERYSELRTQVSVANETSNCGIATPTRSFNDLCFVYLSFCKAEVIDLSISYDF